MASLYLAGHTHSRAGFELNETRAVAGSADPKTLAQLAELRESMLAFATQYLGDPSSAEDCVQESLLAAVTNADQFQRKSTLKTWVFAILRNKLADTLRARYRVVEADALVDSTAAAESFDQLFDLAGHWHADSKPRPWATPEASVENEQLRAVLDICVEGLPARHAQVFLMREILDMDTRAIMASTGLSQSNLNVSLYRARMRLRECLDVQWFNRLEGQLS